MLKLCLLLVALTATTAHCQVIPKTRSVHLTMSYQPGMAQSLANLNFVAYAATVCSNDDQPIDIGGGRIWQAAEEHNVQPVNLLVAATASTQKRAQSKWEIFGVATGEIMFDLSLAGAANIPHVNPAKLIGIVWRMAPLVIAHKITTLNAERAKIQPDPITIFGTSMLDPGAKLSIPASGICVQKLLLAAGGGPKNVSANIVLNTSGLMSDEVTTPPIPTPLSPAVPAKP